MRDLDQFLGHIEEPERVNKWSSMGKVTLMTIHQAKGLEVKRVIVPGLNEGILPHVNSVEQLIMNMEEEWRLMYVAMTRAMDRLIITYRKRQISHPITVASRFLRKLTGTIPILMPTSAIRWVLVQTLRLRTSYASITVRVQRMSAWIADHCCSQLG